MSDFHEVRISEKISYGATGGPKRRVDIVELNSGHEERNTPWSQSRRTWDIGYGIRDVEDVYTIAAFFEAREGQLYGFRFKDWSDYKSTTPLGTLAPTDQQIGTGDASTTAFQLVKYYTDAANSALRTIDKPVSGTVRVALDSVEQLSGWTVDTETGIVTFSSAPGSGVVVTAGYEFDVPVRFGQDQLSINLANYEKGEIPSISLIEVLI